MVQTGCSSIYGGSSPTCPYTKDANGLPAHDDLGATLWLSNVISAGKAIRYVRLTVTNSAGPGSNNWGNHHFFAMGTLNLYSAREVVTINSNYSNLTEEIVIAAKESSNVTFNYDNTYGNVRIVATSSLN